ncbi:MAG: right-handed parallel beta-helix repeat-containing protein [Sphingobacteriales bacterium]|nr:right-handed parallel beta-helix repeat-containing protein [Sphingobacteriales bacterium]
MIISNFHAKQVKVYSLLSVLFFFAYCKKDSITEIQPQKFAADSTSTLSLRDQSLGLTGVTSASYYIEKSLPSGYVKDGSRDYTSYIQSALNKYSNLVFPAFPIMVNDKGLVIGSNKTITFLTGSKLILKPTSLATYNILRISGSTNITLYNPVIVGDRAKHIGTTGEAGVGLAIRGSSYITVYSPNVTNCWGDGIYIGQVENKINCKNIVIKNAVLKKNRRDGISIISVDGLTLESCYAGYSDGTSPYCGINFEANNPSCVMKNINVTNAVTEYNLGNGIQIGTKRMLGQGDRSVSFTFTNHVDTKSGQLAFKAVCTSTTPASTGVMSGLIKVVNPSWKYTQAVPMYYSTNQPNYKLYISSPDVYNPSSSLLSWSQISAIFDRGTVGTGTLTLTK